MRNGESPTMTDNLVIWTSLKLDAFILILKYNLLRLAEINYIYTILACMAKLSIMRFDR